MARRDDPEDERRLAFGRAALGIAYDRLDALESPGSPDQTAVAASVTEVVMWIAGLLEVRAYGRRSELLTAIRWARNIGIHDLIVRAEEATDGVFTIGRSIIGGPDRLAHSKWLQRSALGTPRKTTVDGERAYDAQLAGQPVMTTLRDARALVDAAFAAWLDLVGGR